MLHRTHTTGRECLSVAEPGEGTPARLMPGLRAYPTIVRMFSFGSFLAGVGLIFADSDHVVGWARDASRIVGGPLALGILMVAASCLSTIGQCVERYERVWGMVFSAPLLMVAFAVLWGSASTFLFGTDAGRPSAGMVFGLSSGYFLSYVTAYFLQEVRIRRLSRSMK